MGNDFLRPMVPTKAAISPEVLAPPSITPEVIENVSDIAQAVKTGLSKTASAISKDIGIPRSAPSSLLLSAMKNPVVSLSSLFACINSSSGSSLSERIETVQHMLALMQNESSFNPSARASVKVLYEGRYVISITKGALQFTSATYDAALKKGASIISGDRILRPAYDAALYGARLAGWDWKYGSPDLGLDPNQIMANIGQMAFLYARATKDWTWSSSKGWTPNVAKGPKSAQTELISTFGHYLKDRSLGKQLLFTYYHINGQGASSTSKLYHLNRYTSDVKVFKSIKGIPLFSEFLASSIPELSLYSRAGVGDVTTPQILESTDLGKKVMNDAIKAMIAAGASPSVTADQIKDLVDRDIYDKVAKAQGMASFAKEPFWYNRFIKEIYQFKFDWIPRGTGILNDGFDVYRKRSSGPQIHGGYDLRADVGQPIFAMDAGVCRVFNEGAKKGYGLYVKQYGIVHKAWINYGHLSKVIVKHGEIVNKGDIIAFAGNTGRSFGPHLHIDIRDKDFGPKKRWPMHISNFKDSINAKGA